MAPTKARLDLKARFVRNAIPTEQDFKDLIDSPLNQSDDGIFRNSGEPLSIVAGSDPQKRVLRFYGDPPSGATVPDWLISLNPGQDPNNSATNRRGFGIADGTGATKLFLSPAGSVGIGITAPADRLDVDGRIRAGALTLGPWPANPANYVFIGSSLQDQSNAGNYALLVGTGAEAGTTYLNGSISIGLRIRNYQHFIVTDTGNVGIETTTPVERLHVNGRVRSGALTLGPWPASPENYAFIGSNLLDQTNAANYALLVGTGAESGVTYLNGSAAIGLRIRNDQRVTIATNGFVGVGTMAPGFLLDVNGRMRVRQSGRRQLTAGVWFSGYTSTEADHAFVGMKSVNEVGFYGNTGAPNWRLVVNTDNGNLTVSGNGFKPGGGAWGMTSDRRLKEKIRPIDGALEALLKLKGVSYEWKDPDRQGGLVGPQIGFVAQDVESVFPDWVGLDDEGYKTLTIRGFEALVVEALKQLKAENERLKGQLNRLQEQMHSRFPDLVNV